MFTKSFRAMVILLPAALGLALTTAASAGTTDLAAPTNTAPVTGTATAAPWDPNPPTLVGVRVGRHDAYDRTVFDFTGGTPDYRVEYGPLYSQGRGDLIPLAGGVTLRIVFSGAFAHDINTGKSTLDMGTVLNPGFPTLKQVKFGGESEGYISAGLGLNDRVGFRVLKLTGPPRIAVDVAHQPSQPFSSDGVSISGPHADVVVTGIRTGSHPGYDRVVFDLQGPAPRDLVVGYDTATGTTMTVVMFAGFIPTNFHATYTGPQSVNAGLPAVRSVTHLPVQAGAGSPELLGFSINTTHRHGFRVFILNDAGTTRVVVDVAL